MNSSEICRISKIFEEVIALEDMIIKNTGNSRFLRSVPNALTIYPTYESFIEALVSGTFPIDLNGINPSGVEQSGTKLNKANLLTDALCSALGLANTATPTQAMEKLRQLVNTAQSTADGNNGKTDSGSYISTGDVARLYFNFTPNVVILTAQWENEGKTYYYLGILLNGEMASFRYNSFSNKVILSVEPRTISSGYADLPAISIAGKRVYYVAAG